MMPSGPDSAYLSPMRSATTPAAPSAAFFRPLPSLIESAAIDIACPDAITSAMKLPRRVFQLRS